MSRFLRRAAPAEKTTPHLDAKLSNEGSSGPSTPVAATQEAIRFPSASCKKPEIPQHTPEQTQIMADIKAHLLELHTSLESKDASYVPWERKWIEDPSTTRRYGRAVKWDVAQAKKRAAETMNWRREFKPDLLVPDKVKIEGETGKHIISGFDNASRPVLYLRPGRENTSPSPRQIEYLVWSLERAIGERKM
jgi:4-nitrophenyl phosphatase